MQKYFLWLLLFSVQLQAQIADSAKLVRLEQQLSRLEEKLFQSDSTNYANQYTTAYEGYFLFQKLNDNANDFYSKIRNDVFLVELLNINNPNSLQLQNKILKEMQQLVETKVFNILGRDSTKKRGLFKTIRNVFNNPVVNKILSFVPMNNTITSILNTLASIILPEVKIEQNALRKITSTDIDVLSVLENSPLSEISAKILPYMQFYDSLYNLNNRFSLQIDLIKNKASEIASFVNENRETFIKYSGWKPNVAMPANIEAFDKIYLNYKQVRNNQRFTTEQLNTMYEFYTFIYPFIQENKKYNSLKEAYNQKFVWFKKEYTRLLENFRSKSTILEEMLTPLLARIKTLEENNNDIVVSSPMVAATISKPSTVVNKSAKEIRLDEVNTMNAELYWKHRETAINNQQTDKIKSVIF